MNTTNEIITLVGHSRSVRCLHVDGINEVRLVSGSNDRSIKVCRDELFSPLVNLRSFRFGIYLSIKHGRNVLVN